MRTCRVSQKASAVQQICLQFSRLAPPCCNDLGGNANLWGTACDEANLQFCSSSLRLPALTRLCKVDYRSGYTMVASRALARQKLGFTSAAVLTSLVFETARSTSWHERTASWTCSAIPSRRSSAACGRPQRFHHFCGDLGLRASEACCG